MGDNKRQPGESIFGWWKRLRNQNKYGTYGGELEPASITAEYNPKPTGNWWQRIKKFRHPYGTDEEFERNTRNDESELLSKVNTIDYGDPNQVQDYTDELKNAKTYNVLLEDRKRNIDTYRGNYASSILPFVKNSNGNHLLSQLYRWWSRKKGYQANAKEYISGKGTDFIDLDKNVIRVGPNTKQSTALFNEFVENKRPSVHEASAYQSGKVQSFGDKYNIPTENISIYAGVEDGHFKLDSLNHFDPNTVIFPARNIKKSILPIKKLNISMTGSDPSLRGSYEYPLKRMSRDIDPWYFTRDGLYNEEAYPSYKKDYDEYVHYRDSITNEINDALSKGNTLKATRLVTGDSSAQMPLPYHEIRFVNDDKWAKQYTRGYWPKRLASLSDRLYSIYKNLNNYLSGANTRNYSFIDINGEEHPISDYNATILDSKMVLGNPYGGKFIGRIQDISPEQFMWLNNYLDKYPSWLFKPDLGSYSQYSTHNPTAENYLDQYYEHPKAKDPNVYIVGTTEPNQIETEKVGGKIKSIF